MGFKQTYREGIRMNELITESFWSYIDVSARVTELWSMARLPSAQ